MKVELPIDYATLKRQLQFVTEELEDWKEQYKILESQLNEVQRELNSMPRELRFDRY